MGDYAGDDFFEGFGRFDFSVAVAEGGEGGGVEEAHVGEEHG